MTELSPGCPANNRTLLHAYFLWNYQAMYTADGGDMFTKEQVQNLTKTAVDWFQKKKGSVKPDAFIPDPRADEAAAEEIICLARKTMRR